MIAVTPCGSQGAHSHGTPIKHRVGRNVSTRKGSGHKTEEVTEAKAESEHQLKAKNLRGPQQPCPEQLLGNSGPSKEESTAPGVQK